MADKVVGTSLSFAKPTAVESRGAPAAAAASTGAVFDDDGLSSIFCSVEEMQGDQAAPPGFDLPQSSTHADLHDKT